LVWFDSPETQHGLNLRSTLVFVFPTHLINHLPHTRANFTYNRHYRSNNYALRRDSISQFWIVGILRNMAVEVFVDPQEDSQKYACCRTQGLGASDGN